VHTGPGSPLRAVGLRVMVLGALVAAAVGLRAGSPLDASSDRWQFDDLLHGLGTGLEVALGLWVLVVLVAVVLNGPGEGTKRPVRRNEYLTLALLLGGTLLVVVVRELLPPHRPHVVRPTPDVASPAPSVGHRLAQAGDHRGLALLVLLAAVAVLTAVIASRRQPEQEVVEQDLPDPLGDGIAAAGRSLRDTVGEQPRARVLLAYAAFEQALASQGIARGVSGTPEALLQKAVEAGAPGAPASRLTGLFGAARFGAEPVTADDVVAAERALDDLRASR
jgi:hypothetical protein